MPDSGEHVSRLRLALRWGLLALAIAMLGVGAFRTHTVYREVVGQEPLDPVEAALSSKLPQIRRSIREERITESQLTADATFSGVRREKGKLWTSYDHREGLPGKQPCPT